VAAQRARDASFDRARLAAEQRSATSLAEVSADLRPDARVVAGRTFVLRDSVWTDTRVDRTTRRVLVQPYSAAWFELVGRIPELKEVFALGERVLVGGKSVVVGVAATGSATLTAAQLQSVVAAW
jgi:hypothetical protein